MNNLPLEHHHLNTHARHRAKTLTALLWVARFRWTASALVDQLLGGSGLVRQLISNKLVVEHPISNPFSPVRFYVTLGSEGLELLHRYWPEITRGTHGPIASSLSSDWSLPARQEHRIRQARFQHDLEVQLALIRTFQAGSPIQSLLLADDLERVPLDQRPAKIPDIALQVRTEGTEASVTTSTLWGEVEYSRKKPREVDLFCAYYRGALAGTSECKFDRIVVLCHETVLAQWRKDFARTVVPKWLFRKATRDWIRLDPKHWYHFPELPTGELEWIIQPLTPQHEDAATSA